MSKEIRTPPRGSRKFCRIEWNGVKGHVVDENKSMLRIKIEGGHYAWVSVRAVRFILDDTIDLETAQEKVDKILGRIGAKKSVKDILARARSMKLGKE